MNPALLHVYGICILVEWPLFYQIQRLLQVKCDLFVTVMAELRPSSPDGGTLGLYSATRLARLV